METTETQSWPLCYGPFPVTASLSQNFPFLVKPTTDRTKVQPKKYQQHNEQRVSKTRTEWEPELTFNALLFFFFLFCPILYFIFLMTPLWLLSNTVKFMVKFLKMLLSLIDDEIDENSSWGCYRGEIVGVLKCENTFRQRCLWKATGINSCSTVK